jgi:hypothetical protein
MDLETGLKQAAAAAVREAAAGPAEPPRQLDLLGLPTFRTSDGREVVPSPRGPGRPAGSSNVLTRWWREYLLSNYPSPLEGLVATAALGVADLSKSLRFSALKAMNIKIRCMEYSTAFLFPRLQATLFRRSGDPDGDDPATLILTEQFLDMEPSDPPPDGRNGEFSHGDDR